MRSAAQRQARLDRRAAGICRDCPNPSGKFHRCFDCRRKATAKQLDRYYKAKETKT